MKATWVGIVAGTDGSADEMSEHMGAGYAIGAQLVPIQVLSALVCGPLASIRPEEASLL